MDQTLKQQVDRLISQKVSELRELEARCVAIREELRQCGIQPDSLKPKLWSKRGHGVPSAVVDEFLARGTDFSLAEVCDAIVVRGISPNGQMQVASRAVSLAIKQGLARRIRNGRFAVVASSVVNGHSA
jgi:hypothetical protein